MRSLPTLQLLVTTLHQQHWRKAKRDADRRPVLLTLNDASRNISSTAWFCCCFVSLTEITAEKMINARKWWSNERNYEKSYHEVWKLKIRLPAELCTALRQVFLEILSLKDANPVVFITLASHYFGGTWKKVKEFKKSHKYGRFQRSQINIVVVISTLL